jgi:2-polyprenyl-6-methoxyphenol hydroxylase-like FAD-dependent oxidoreductase
MIGIIGAGMSGLFSARALAKSGYEVMLFETDSPAPGDSAETAFMGWQRAGVAQFRQPHSARSVITKVLRERDPELLQAMITEGMKPWEFHLLGLENDALGHDPELVGLLGRRSALEVPLRRIVEAMPGVKIVRTTVKGLLFAPTENGQRVEGVITTEGPQFFDCILDASGRRSKIADWLFAAGLRKPYEESSECGITYYSQFFRFHPGISIPRGLYPSGPSASLPGVHYTMNRTDGSTFSVMLGVAPWQEEFRVLRHDNNFLNFMSRLPDTNKWLDPSVSAPIWKVEPYAGLTNRYRRFTENGKPLVRDLYVMGDARFHTNPVLGWGMSFAMQMSFMLADTFSAHSGSDERLAAFEEQADAYARRYYDTSSREDEARTQLWKDPSRQERGEPGSYRYLLTTVLPAVYRDQYIFRKVTRRVHLLDNPEDILTDPLVLERAQAIGATLNQKFTCEQLIDMVQQASNTVQARNTFSQIGA